MEDHVIVQMVREVGPKWKIIKDQLPGRTVAMVRNRWMRIEKGRKKLEEGGDVKNRCQACGEPKLGHICQAKMSGGPKEDDEEMIDEMPETDDALDNVQLVFDAKRSTHCDKADRKYDGSVRYLVNATYRSQLETVVLLVNARTQQPASLGPLMLVQELVFDESDIPVPAVPGNPPFEGTVRAELVNGRATFRSRIVINSAKHANQLFRLRIRPEDDELAAQYPALTLRSPFPLCALSKLDRSRPNLHVGGGATLVDGFDAQGEYYLPGGAHGLPPQLGGYLPAAKRPRFDGLATLLDQARVQDYESSHAEADAEGEALGAEPGISSSSSSSASDGRAPGSSSPSVTATPPSHAADGAAGAVARLASSGPLERNADAQHSTPGATASAVSPCFTLQIAADAMLEAARRLESSATREPETPGTSRQQSVEL